VLNNNKYKNKVEWWKWIKPGKLWVEIWEEEVDFKVLEDNLNNKKWVKIRLKVRVHNNKKHLKRKKIEVIMKIK